MSETTKPEPQPYLTVRFYTDGHAETVVGPSRFPIDPDDIQRCLGSVTLMLWQVAQMANSRMVALRLEQMKLEAMLQAMDAPGEPN